MKVYLCGITQNEKESIDELTKDVYDDFDGLIFVDGGSTDGTKELLEERKKDGAVLHRKWTNDHDFQMNEFLRQGPMKLGDWFMTLDSMERLNPDFTKNIREFIDLLLKNQVRTVFNYGKGFMWEYFDDMFFLGSPHWGLNNSRQRMVEMSKTESFEDPNTYSYNVRDEKRPPHHFVDHFVKYYYVYGRTNHLLLGREDKKEEFEMHETNRQAFRFYCTLTLGLDLTLDALKDHLKNTSDWKKDEKFMKIFDKEKILKDFYRWHVLKHPVEELEEKNGKEWKLDDEN